MMFGPKMMDRPEDQGRAASILVFFLVLGLTASGQSICSTPAEDKLFFGGVSL